MIIFITGASHTGKTFLAQKLLEKYHYPYLSIDHLKMGLIRSGNTHLTPLSSDEQLTEYLWPIVREMVKTAIENKQNLIVEGCYIPCDYQESFSPKEREEIRFLCLVFSENYIKKHFDQIKSFANVIEERLCDSLKMEEVLFDNAAFLSRCQKEGIPYLLVEDEYDFLKKVNF